MISSSTAAEVARGVSRLLLEEGYSPVLEFTLPNGRRLDVAAIGPGGEMLGVEIKVALADLKGDTKWPEYLDYCDLFYFAIPPDFPPGVNTEGWVKVQFSITAAGTVRDAFVVDASPKGVFDSAALKAIARWRYSPKVDGGVAVESVGLQTLIHFELQ